MECSSPCTDDFYSYYTSEPTSPRKCNHKDGVFFLSMPTSPTRDPPGYNSRSITPVETRGNFSLYVENFEFEGSKRYYGYDENESEKSQDLSMAYADELFCEGRMLPLRAPPRSRYTGPDKRRGDESTASSPGARSSVLKVPFLKQRSLWNDGFDPFLAALNKIKEENEGVSQNEKKAHLRRSKSLSLYRKPNGPDIWNTHKHEDMGLSPQSDISGPVKRNFLRSIQEPIKDKGKSKSLESSKQRMKKFLLNNASFGKEGSGQKREQKTPLFPRKVRDSKRLGATNSNAIIRISREMKSLMKHRARIFFRLAKSFGIKGTTKMS